MRLSTKLLLSTAVLSMSGFIGSHSIIADAKDSVTTVQSTSATVKELPTNTAYHTALSNKASVTGDIESAHGVKIDRVDPEEEKRKAEEAQRKADEEAARKAQEEQQNAQVDNSATPAINAARANVVNGPNAYPVGQCTWGAKELAPWVGSYWGNANQWAASALAEGHQVGTTPVVGAIAMWATDGGGYGHVAVVSAVQSEDNIQVMESNYAGNQSIGNYRGWFNPKATWSGSPVLYIYP